jgi:hypothetical protein
MTDRPTDESEFGGAPGLIQPPPHDVSKNAREQRMLIVATDPSDPESNEETVMRTGRYGRLD